MTSNDIRVVKRGNTNSAGGFGKLLGLLEWLNDVVARENNFGAIGPRCLQFGQSYANRSKDGGLNAQFPGSKRHALGVVAGTGRDNALGPLGGG